MGLTDWLAAQAEDVVIDGLADKLRLIAGVGAVARAYKSQSTTEQCLSLWALCTAHDAVAAGLRTAVDLYRAPLRDVLPSALRHYADRLADALDPDGGWG